MRIGLISDTHMAGSGRGLPQGVLRALQGVDLILHCGDLECLGVLDLLEGLAPVLAVRGYEDPVEPGGRLASATRVVEAGGVRIGMVHDIQWPPPRIVTSPDATSLTFPPGPGRELLARKFGQPVDVVVFGDTHQELVCWYDGVLLVNPGSPTYPTRRRPGGLGTLGFLDVDHGLVSVRLLELTA
jgi:putative phosphoesterase